MIIIPRSKEEILTKRNSMFRLKYRSMNTKYKGRKSCMHSFVTVLMPLVKRVASVTKLSFILTHHELQNIDQFRGLEEIIFTNNSKLTKTKW